MIALAIVAAFAPTRVHTPPKIDGVLDDAVWQTVAASDRDAGRTPWGWSWQ